MAAVTTLCFIGKPAFAGKSSPVDLIKKELKSVPVPELGATAARLVAQAKLDARESTAVAAIAAAIELKPVAAVAVVSAISREAPDVAPAVAGRAASALPKDAAALARAAAGAAPTQAAKIVSAVCKAVPTKYAAVAVAVAQAVPYASREIVDAVIAALPSLKPFVERADSSLTGGSKSVGNIMTQTESLVAYAAQATGSSQEKIITTPPSTPTLISGLSSPQAPTYSALPPPVVGPPFTPLLLPPSEINRSNTTEIPPGGVRYSGP